MINIGNLVSTPLYDLKCLADAFTILVNSRVDQGSVIADDSSDTDPTTLFNTLNPVFKYIAVNVKGRMAAFEEKPTRVAAGWMPLPGTKACHLPINSYRYGWLSWDNSLVKRPKERKDSNTEGMQLLVYNADIYWKKQGEKQNE